MRLKVHWKSTLPPSWAQWVLTSLCRILNGFVIFNGCPLPTSLLSQERELRARGAVLRTHLRVEAISLQRHCLPSAVSTSNRSGIGWRWLGEGSNIPTLQPLLLGLCLYCSLAGCTLSPWPRGSCPHFTPTFPPVSLLLGRLPGHPPESNTLPRPA